MKRAIVLSSGGSKGAYAVGIVKRYFEIGKRYDIIVGTSTGALIAPFIASENLEALIEGYTNIKHSDIFNINPFKIKKSKTGIYTWDINKLAVFYNRFILRSSSFGSTERLRYLTIPKFFTKTDFDLVLNSEKDLCICVSNISLDACEIKNLRDCDYDRFCDWMWASTCAPPVMSVPFIEGYEYVDGAVTKPIPIDEAILRGADEIDVIILETKNHVISKLDKIKNDTQLQLRTNNMLLKRLLQSNINLAYLADLANKDVKLNFHYTEHVLTNNSLIFDSDLMKEWLDLGYEYAAQNRKESYLLMGGSNKYIKLPNIEDSLKD